MDYIKYTIDGKTTYLEQVNGKWVEILIAPQVAGTYDFQLELNKDGNITYVESTDPRLGMTLDVENKAATRIDLIKYVPEFMRDIKEFQYIFDAENSLFNTVARDIEHLVDQLFIDSASPSTILRWETFLGIKGEGTLAQRKSYILALIKKGEKLSEKSIKTIVNTITGSDAVVTFFAEDDSESPKVGQPVLLVQVLSPDNHKDYKYDDIQRILEPLTPAHIHLIVVKYFATWENIKDNYSSWGAIANTDNWKVINDYIPPM